MGRVRGGLQDPPRNGEGDRAATRRGGGGSPPLQRPEVYAARKLRREMSLPEVLLWQRLRGEQCGVKFRRQHPIGPYVADFYCPARGTIIEIDGEAHSRGDRPERDAQRDEYLGEKGYRLIRIPAADVLRDPDEVALSIAALLGSPLHRPEGPVPLPASGEDQHG